MLYSFVTAFMSWEQPYHVIVVTQLPSNNNIFTNWRLASDTKGKFAGKFLSPSADNCSTGISGRGWLVVAIFSWPNLHERMCRTGRSRDFRQQVIVDGRHFFFFFFFFFQSLINILRGFPLLFCCIYESCPWEPCHFDLDLLSVTKS